MINRLRVFWARVVGGSGSRLKDADLQREISAHIDEAAEELQRQGLPAGEARRLAFARFGGVTQAMEAHRAQRRFRPFGSFRQDLAYGARMLVRKPGFTLAAVLTLALGILANTTIVSAVNAVLFRPLAIDKPAQIHQIINGSERAVDGDSGNDHSAQFSYRVYKSLREAATMFDGLLATWRVSTLVNVAPSDTSRAAYAGRRQGEIVSGNYFTLFGLRASHGRLLTEDDDRTPNAHPVVVLSEKFWRTHLDSDPNVVGRLVKLGGHPFTVIGIAPASFTGTVFATDTDFWASLMMQGRFRGQFGIGDSEWYTGARTHYVVHCTRANGARAMIGTIFPTAQVPKFKLPADAKECGPVRESGQLRIFGRLPGDVSRTAAESQLNAIAGHLAQPFYANQPGRFTLQPEVEARHKDYSKQVRLISLLALGASVLVWLVACGNVANLLLTRSTTRRRELAVRLSLGAGRWRVARQLLTESGMIAIVSGGVATALTFWTSKALSSALPMGLVPGLNLDFSPDLRVLGWALGLSLVTGIVFGTAPAWQSARMDLIPALKPGDSGSAKGARRLTLRNGLVVGQLSLSVIVLVAAGLFIRSLGAARESLGPSFSSDRLVSMRFDLQSLGYTPARIDTFYRDLATRAGTIPRVDSASIVSAPPFGAAVGSESAWLSVEGGPITREPGREIETVLAGPRYFQTMGIPLVAGREFEDRDTTKSGPVAIINRAEARRLFGDERQALGRRVVLTRGSAIEIFEVVGISPDARDGETSRILHVPAYQRGSSASMTLVAQAASASDLRAVADGARALVKQIDAQAPMFDLRVAADHDDPRLGAIRLTAELASALGLAALAMAMFGLYGVMAYAVTLRRREIGIRMALGAPASDVRALVVREALALTAIGLVIGFLGAYLLAPVIDRLLIRMPATDPMTFAGVAVLLTTTTLLACDLPARRATRVNPTLALRCD